jgi:DNA-binding HxlR family transcriptional regulator
MTARQLLAKRLYEAARPLALHELAIPTVSQTAASARLREMKRDGIVVSVPVPGKKFTAWMLTPADLTLPLVVL